MMPPVNWQPTNRQLCQFGFIALVAFPPVGWLWSGGNLTVAAVAAGIGAVLAAAGVAQPSLLRPLFIALSLTAAPIGFLVGELLVATIYFGLFLPIGLVFRMIGRDGLQRKWHRDRSSYWQDKPQPAKVESYYRQW